MIKYKAAQLISVLGHPLLLGSAISILVFFQLFDFRKAFFLSGYILCFISIPAGVWIYYKIKKGVYTNFDVSVRSHRTSLYVVLLGLLVTASLIAWLSHQPRTLLIGLNICGMIVVVSFLLNYLLKTSLHAAMSFFLAFVLWHIHSSWGIAMFFMAMLITASRLILKRHTLPEVISGSFVGSAAGAFLFYYLPAGYGG